MDADSLSRGLTTARFGRRLFYFDRIDSTNSRAAAELQRGVLPEGTAFVAEVQIRGRGTSGRKWWSADTEGLWLSVVLPEPLRAQPLPFVAGVAVVDALRRDFGVDAHLKWPNDVLIEDRKVCGTLIESQRQPDGKLAWIMGIGINANQQCFPEAIAARAVSMRMATGAVYRREDLFCSLMRRLEETYAAHDLVAAWRARTRVLGRRLTVARGSQRFSVVAVDVTPLGHLVVMHDDGRREEWVACGDLDFWER